VVAWLWLNMEGDQWWNSGTISSLSRWPACTDACLASILGVQTAHTGAWDQREAFLHSFEPRELFNCVE